MKFLLLVTWMNVHAFSSYQVVFDSEQLCDDARDALIKDYVSMGVGPDIKISIVCTKR